MTTATGAWMPTTGDDGPRVAAGLVPSRSQPGVWYITIVFDVDPAGRTMTCTCPAGRHRPGRWHRHGDDLLAAVGPPPS